MHICILCYQNNNSYHMHITKTCASLKVHRGTKITTFSRLSRAPIEVRFAIILTTKECQVDFCNVKQSTCDVGGHLFICQTSISTWSFKHFNIPTPKCVVIHFGFHQILSEFGHFYLVKLINPLKNEDQLLWTTNCFTSTQ